MGDVEHRHNLVGGNDERRWHGEPEHPGGLHVDDQPELAARLENAGVAVRREIATVADQRCAAEVISFRDP